MGVNAGVCSDNRQDKPYTMHDRVVPREVNLSKSSLVLDTSEASQSTHFRTSIVAGMFEGLLHPGTQYPATMRGLNKKTCE